MTEEYFENDLNITQTYYNLEECKKEYKKILKENPALQNKLFSDILKEMKQMDDNFPPPEIWMDYYKINRIEEIIGYISILKRRKKFNKTPIHQN